ncbi:MAG: hypothetical protein ACM3NT_10765, partial [Methylocystaceae bacterium]
MITDYYIIATLIYLSCMGVVYRIWRRNIGRREYLLLFLVGLLMVWASPILMQRLGPTTLVLVYTLIPLAAAVISTRIGKKKNPDQDDKLEKLEISTDSAIALLPESGVSEPPESDDLPPENKRKLHHCVRRWSDLGPLTRPHPHVVEVSYTLVSELAVDVTDSAVEGMEVTGELPQESPVEILAIDAMDDSADIIEPAEQVSENVAQDHAELPKESLTEVLDTTYETIELVESKAEFTAVAGISDESLPAIEETELIDNTIDIVEPIESEPETEVAEEETDDTVEPTDTELKTEAAEGADETSDENLPALEETEQADSSIEMTESEDKAAEEASGPVEVSLAEAVDTETVNATEDIIIPIALEADDEHAEIEPSEDSLSIIEEAETVDDTAETIPTVEAELATKVIEKETDDTVEPTDTELQTEVTKEADETSDENPPVIEETKQEDNSIETIESDDEAAEVAVELSEESLSEVEGTEAVDERVEMAGDFTITNEEIENPDQEIITVSELVTDGLSKSGHVVNALDVQLEEIISDNTGLIQTAITSAVFVESTTETSAAQLEYKAEIVNENKLINRSEADDETGEGQYNNILKTNSNEGIGQETTAEKHMIDKTTEKVGIEVPSETVVDQAADNTIIGQQSDDIEQEIRHNIAEGNLPADTKDEFSQDIEAGIMPVLSEQKQVKSARQRMMEEKV